MKNILQHVLLILLMTAVSGNLFAKDGDDKNTAITVTGRVISKETDQDEALPGVSITIRGTTSGTVTDSNGEYKVEVPSEESVLVFSFIGYKTMEMKVGQQTVIDMVLTPDVATLDEVVIVGAVFKKSDLTGAVASISDEKLKEIPTSNFTQALQGRMAGVLVQNDPRPGGGGTSVKIRGNNSLQFGASPIYVVDGLIMDGGLNLINPNDIASIDVLKDASATAIYGSRGANGVVIVTTKKGKQGQGRVTYDGWWGVQEFTKTMPRLGAKDIVDLRVDAFANTFMDNNPAADRNAFVNSALSDGSTVFADYELESYRNGKSYNWLDEVTRSGAQQNHTVSFSKATDEGSYYISFNYVDQKGLIENAGYNRYSGRANIEQNVKSWLKIGTNTSYSRSAETFVEGSVFPIANNANPLLPIDPSLTYLKWAGIEDVNLYNPLKSLTIDGDSYQSRLMTSNYVSIKPIDGLTLRSTISIDLMDKKDLWYTPKDIGQSLRNSTQGTASHRNDHWFNWQWDNTATYEKVIAGKHNISGLFGFSMQRNQWDYSQISATGFATDDFSYKYINSAYLKDKFGLGSDFTASTLMSYIGRVNYSYENRYFATVTARSDGSSKFDSGHKWGVFPSVALGWNIAEESFFQAGSVDLLKLRLGYGSVGNQNIPVYAYKSLYRPTFTNNSVVYQSDGRLGNPNVAWERQKQLNIGVDLAILNDRVTFTAEYFDINNDDLLMQRTLPPSIGFGNTIANIGAMTNKGVEFSIGATVLDKGDFRLKVAGNISTFKSKVTKLYGDVNAIYNQGGYTGVEIQREGNFFLGESLNSIYVYKFKKIAQESDMADIGEINYGSRIIHPGDIIPVDRDGNKIINDDDRYVVGKKDPKFYGGFSTDLSYKNFTLNAVFNYNYGAKRISYLYEGLMGGSGMGPAHEDMLDRWTPEHTNTNVPRAYSAGGRYSIGDVDWGVQDASFLRLTAITIAYNFSESLIKKAKLTNARIYISGNNLFTITKYKGYDPEGGDDYPMQRMLVAGVNLGF